MVVLAVVVLCLVLAAWLSGFMVGKNALLYRRRWKEALALIEVLAVEDRERREQWEAEQLEKRKATLERVRQKYPTKSGLLPPPIEKDFMRIALNAEQSRKRRENAA